MSLVNCNSLNMWRIINSYKDDNYETDDGYQKGFNDAITAALDLYQRHLEYEKRRRVMKKITKKG